ncbi:uncharacterized protein N7482_007639 [Penicillium canariense]|uniref:Uncharacterized protein n=1 Tax=Penicillium canariense TaxID=189055 RepID=A0A9W9HZY1_9EURO|nr:uncharacterized protein N7482_007639 [Penicillium canariense]KAJ5160635.1 hypothetical protein N7482_007639 [Penicillium canariense]
MADMTGTKPRPQWSNVCPAHESGTVVGRRSGPCADDGLERAGAAGGDVDDYPFEVPADERQQRAVH